MLRSSTLLRRPSNTKRTGHSAGAPSVRAVRLGLSAMTVPAPTAIAGKSRRHRWTSARATSPVIHLDSPPRVAILPSSVAASLPASRGPRLVIQWLKIRLKSRHSASRTPVVTATPAWRSTSKPLPACAGLGSAVPATTRLDARGDDGVRAGPRPPRGRAGLHRDIERSPRPGLRMSEAMRHPLGVGGPVPLVEPLGRHLAVLDQDAPHHRIRVRVPPGAQAPGRSPGA